MKLFMIDDTRSFAVADRQLQIAFEQRERIREWSKNGYRDQLAGM
jgi:hypothetical protein